MTPLILAAGSSAELANADTAQRLSRGEKVSVLWDDSAQIKLAD